MREGTCSNLNGVICQIEDPLQNLVFGLSLRKQLIDCVVFVPLTSFQFFFFLFLSHFCVITIGLVSQTHSFCGCFFFNVVCVILIV